MLIAEVPITTSQHETTSSSPPLATTMKPAGTTPFATTKHVLGEAHSTMVVGSSSAEKTKNESLAPTPTVGDETSFVASSKIDGIKTSNLSASAPQVTKVGTTGKEEDYDPNACPDEISSARMNLVSEVMKFFVIFKFIFSY